LALKEKAPAAKRLAGGCNERTPKAFGGSGLRTPDKLREPSCEWRKGGIPNRPALSGRGMPYMEVEGRRGFCLSFRKNRDGLERTIRGYRFNRQSAAEAL